MSDAHTFQNAREAARREMRAWLQENALSLCGLDERRRQEAASAFIDRLVAKYGYWPCRSAVWSVNDGPA